jgi:septal ring factor EnvC (AmiA/AmiB activator)
MLLTSKLAIFEKQKDNFDQDVAFLKKKEKELQLLNEDQSRKYKELERTCKAKDLDLEGLKQSETALNTYINNLKLQIE